jgi:small subunit ribosomal protein S21
LKEIAVKVYDNDIEKAMRILKKKIQNDGLFKRLKLSEALRRERLAAARKSRYRR